MAEIKLPALPKHAGHIEEHFGLGVSKSHLAYTADQMRAYAEAAVLSANAGKVDAKLLSDAKHALERQRVWGGTSWTYNALQPRDYLPILKRIDDAMSSPTQQAIDAGKV